MVTAKATVARVIQKEIETLSDAISLVKKHKKALCFTESSLEDTSWLTGKRYAILIFLKDPKQIEPFTLDKTGYGNACAWICTENIELLHRNRL